MIELRNVSKTYEPNIKALDGVGLKIEKGSIFGIIGLSGAGKSTLIRTINGLEKIDDGQILIEGRDISKLTGKDLLSARQKIGIIFQHFNLLIQQTVFNNVLLPLRIAGKPDRSKVIELLKLVGLEDKVDAYPEQLSGGQKQRVAIARALANDPSILLVDEATSALDPQTTRSILDLLKNLHKQLGFTIVLITHEMSVIEYLCESVAILDQGQVVEVGDVKTIFKRPQSLMGRKLIYPQTQSQLSKNELRITFDGPSAIEPIISEMVLKTGHPVSILSADMKTLNEQTVGQLIVRVPDDEQVVHRMCEFLTHHNIEFERGPSL